MCIRDRYVGALCVLSFLWVLNEIFNLRMMHSGKMIMKHSPVAVQYENIQAILFYIGLTLMAGVCVETGVVDSFTQWICEKTGNPYILSAIGGGISILLDVYKRQGSSSWCNVRCSSWSC